MKTILYPIAILSLILTSCELKPDAYFFTDKTEVVTGEEVFFTNNSINAYRYEWDFGDGQRSTAMNPIYAYSSTGTFQVMLTAISKRGHSSYAYQTITVKYPTTLEIEVLEFFDEYPVSGASVLLYPTLKDWDDETNSLVEGFTNSSGMVIFSNLGAFVYYIDVWEKNHNNYTLRNEDVGFIRTDQLIPNQINRFVAWVDYVGGKGSTEGSRDRTMVIRKLERKYSDKPGQYPGQ